MSSNCIFYSENETYIIDRVKCGEIVYEPFYSVACIWVDGFKFVLGSFTKGNKDSLLELSTRLNAVRVEDIKGRSRSTQTWLNTLLEKIERSKSPIASVIRKQEEYDARNTTNRGRRNLWKVTIITESLSQSLLDLPF